jgi:hypothetical protein
MNDAEVRQAFDPLYADIKPEAQFFNAQPLLAHYTTIETIEQIVRSKQMWFSNPLYMNDIEEVGFGLIEGENAITSSQALSDACGTSERRNIFMHAYGHYSRHYIENHLADTYVLCFSRHDSTDNDGLLSMWRGYGGNGNGAAIVIDTAKLSALPTSSLILAHVEYATTQERRDWLVALATQFSNILAALNLPNEQIHIAASALLDRVRLAALFSKHKGFHEEQEWRVVYMRERDQNKVFDPMLSYMTSARGIEKKLKFKVAYHPGATSEDLSLSKLVDRIILGPTISSPIAAAAFKRMLLEHGEPDLIPRVLASTIPYRHKG